MLNYTLFIYTYKGELLINYDIISLLLRLQNCEVDITIVTDLNQIDDTSKKKMSKYFGTQTKFRDFVNFFNTWVKDDSPKKLNRSTITFKSKYTKKDFESFVKTPNTNVVHFIGHMSDSNEYQFNLYDSDKKCYVPYMYPSCNLVSVLQNIPMTTLVINDCCYGPQIDEYHMAFKHIVVNKSFKVLEIEGSEYKEIESSETDETKPKVKHYVWNISQNEKHVSRNCTKTIYYFSSIYNKVVKLFSGEIDEKTFFHSLYPAKYAILYNQTFYEV